MKLLFQNIIKSGLKVACIDTDNNTQKWFDMVPHNCIIDNYGKYIDENNFSVNMSKFNFIKLDYSKFHKNSRLNNYYDLVIAENTFSKARSTEALTNSIKYIIKPTGFLLTTLPDPNSFSDIFYRLIHPECGGRINHYSKESFIEFMAFNGFELVTVNEIDDNWDWLKDSYYPEKFEIETIEKNQVEQIAECFKKELIAEKGYSFGWEFLFKLKSEKNNINENKQLPSKLSFKTKRGYSEY